MKKFLIEKIDNLMRSAQFNKEKGDLSSCISNLKEILEIDSNNKKALNNIGNAYKEIKKFDEALKYYSKSISLDQNYVIAKTNLAILHHDLGNLEEAEKLYKDLIISDKFNFAIYFNLSRINFKYFDKDKIDFIEKALENENINNYQKASGYFILAKYQQMNNNFNKEIYFLEKGHEYLCKAIPFKIHEQRQNYWLNIIPKKFDKFRVVNIEKENNKEIDINPIYIIGMPRSGSTLVESIISSGKINIPNGGETAVINWALLKNARNKLFDSSLDKVEINKKILKKDILSRYQSLNLLNENKKYFFTDKSLENFFYMEIILDLFPNAKFIHCKRNEIDNIFAIYQNFFTKMSWTHSLKDIISYFDNYLRIIHNFTKKNKDKLFTVELEDLTLNSEKISKEMFNFCKLEWSSDSLEYHKRKDLFSTTASNIQIREKIYKYNKEKYNYYKKYLKEFEPNYVWLKKKL